MHHPDWYEHWFDTQYYHLLYQHRDDKEAQFFIDKLCLHINWSKDCKLIDIACGKGRHSIYLNKLGFDVTGIDLSVNSIEKAREYENKTLHFHVHDMRRTFKKNYFDGALNLFTSFGYFKNSVDNENSISAMASNLKRGGHLVIDYLNMKPLMNDLEQDFHCKKGAIEFTINKRIDEGYLLKEIFVKDGEKKRHFIERLHIYNLQEFEAFFNEANLKIISVFGNYALESFDVNSSDRLILVGEKI